MMKLLLALDKVPASARDQVKTQQEQLQKQQQLMQQQQQEIRQQHRQTQEAIKKLQEAQAETSLLLRSGVGATTAKTPSHSLPSEVRDILSDQGAKIDSLTNDLKALLHEQRQSPQQQTRKKPKPQPQKQQQQRLQRSQDQPQRQNSRHQLQQQPSTTERSDEGQATTEGEGTPWKTVSRRGKPRGKVKSLDLVRSRVPKGAAVTISRPAEGVTYSDIMRKVKANVQINDLDLKPEARVTKSGGILLKVKDDQEADRLMVALNSAIGQMASVSKPSRTTPILILDLAEWHNSQDVEEAVAAAVPDLAGMKVAIRVNPGGGRVGRLDAPLPAAVRLAEMGKLHVGWSRCRVKLLEAKEPTCYRCQKRGHFAANCSAEEARKRCFRCNSVDHLASACTVTTRRPNKSPEREAKGPDLLMKFMQEEAIDVAILSDPYRICDNGCDSLADSALGRAAILVPGKQVTVCNVIRDAEFVSARVGGYQIYSCYATPNPATRDMFGSLLRRLENSVRTVMHDTPVVVAGDFNARSAAWGDRVTTSRGDELCDLLGSLQLIVLNEGSTPTFNRGEGSIIDVTAVSERVRCLTWSVLGDTFNNSDHNYIRFDLDSGTGIRRQNLCSSARGWDVTKGIDPELLEVGLLIAEWLSPVEDLNHRDAAHIADFFDCHVKTACDIVLRRKSAPNMARKPVHWWNPELSVLRSNCVSARRCKTRLAARHKRLQQRLGVTNPTVVQAVLDVDAADAQLRMCKKALKTAVARSKKACWDELVQSVESDPFGKPYKLVMRKLSGPPATDRMELDTLRSTIETLFPAGHPNIHGAVLPLEPFEAFTAEEVADVVTLFGSRRTAPGPDGIANLIIGSVHKVRPDMLRHMYNRCLKEGVFPPRWKEARVVLLRKGDRPEGVPSSYRPLCLLND
ncbi:hypothetical protein AGLY_017263, partial [Aphis glycines]